METESIDIEEFEAADEEGFSTMSDTERIVHFLATHDEKAWKAKAIAEHVDVNPDSISTLLSRLKKRGLVRHKEPYWAITSDTDRLRRAYQTHRMHDRLNERYGEEDPDDWLTDDTEELE